MQIKTVAGIAAFFSVIPSAYAYDINEELSLFGDVKADYEILHDQGKHQSGAFIREALVGLNYKPNEQFEFSPTIHYEQDINGVTTKVEVDEATATWHALAKNQLDLKAGRTYLPFGQYETEMINDPITSDLGKTRTNALLQASTKQGNVTSSLYAFQGKALKTDSNAKHKTGFGGSVNYETDGSAFGLDYTSNLGEAQQLTTAKTIPGLALHGSAKLEGLGVKLIGEHLQALKALQAGDLEGAVIKNSKPQATHLEAQFDLKEDRLIAASYNKTSQAADLDLPKTSYGLTYSQPLYKNLKGAVELMQQKDYASKSSKALTFEVKYEF